MQYLQIKNWEKFQHYKDRSPPWIKLHRELLNDYTFTSLQDASKAHLMLLWLLASQLDNKIPNDIKWLKSRLGLTSNIDIKELINQGFLVVLQDASMTQAFVTPETETETERDKSAAEAPPPSKVLKIPKGSRISPDWKLPLEWGEWALREGLSRQQVLSEEDSFKDYWLAKTGKDATKADWQATWRNWVRRSKEFKRG